MIEFSHVTVRYGAYTAVEDVTLSIPRGKVTVFAGPNGCGKTTLLKAAARLLPLAGGEITCGGKPLSAYGRREFAKTLSVLPQGREALPISVETLVMHGRFPYLGLSRKPTSRDRAIVRRAMELAGIFPLREKPVTALSGGERQKAYIAMAVAQDTPVLLLDEPTTYLDIGRQFEILDTVRALRKQGKTILMVLHDLPQALETADRLAVFDAGRLLFSDTPQRVLESGVLQRTFSVRIVPVPGGGYCCQPLRR